MKKIEINGIKNIKKLEFKIPNPGVYLITGKNGVGKTTLFTCLSRIHNSNAFRNGFPSVNNNALDEFSGSITYYSSDDVKVTYSKRKSGEWRPNNRLSVLQSFNYPSVINITTKNKRVFSQEKISPRKQKPADSWIKKSLIDCLGDEKFDKMVQLTTGDLRRGRGNVPADSRRRNIAFAIPLENGKYYTEQNFSFGEIVLLNLLTDLKEAINGSMILIDELELALHPSAQIKLFEALKKLSKEKGLTIIISTHSSSLIRMQRTVILLEQDDEGVVNVIYNCPPAKAIGAIGLREDTMPDIVVLVEDLMAKHYYNSMKQLYFTNKPEDNYLDIRIFTLGGFFNIVQFLDETRGSLFYDNIKVVAYLDKDVETDVVEHRAFLDQKWRSLFDKNENAIKFLPYTPEVALAKFIQENGSKIINSMKQLYNNQQLQCHWGENIDIEEYLKGIFDGKTQEEYASFTEKRGAFRTTCKTRIHDFVKEISGQLNELEDSIIRHLFKMMVETDKFYEENIVAYFAPTYRGRRAK